LLFAVYLFIAFPGLSPFRDAGDFAAAVPSLGIAHPPGYPLYVLAGRVVQSLVPWGNPAYRLNLFSAFCGAGVGMFVFLILRRWGGRPAALWGTAAAAFAPSALSQYNLSEIYALNALLGLALLWGAVSFPSKRQVWPLLGFVMGLGLANHQTLVLAGPALLTVLLREKKFSSRLALSFLAALILGFSLSLFLFFRARAGAQYVWGEPHHFPGLWRILTRADYGAGTLSTRYSAASPAQGLLFWFKAWKELSGGVGSVLSVLALAWAFRKKNRALWGGPLLVLWIFTGPFFGFLSRLSDSALSRAILQPMLLIPAVAAAMALGLMWGQWSVKGGGWTLAALASSACFFSFQSVPALAAACQRENVLALDYGRHLLRSVPPGGTLLMISDAALFSVASLQALGHRPDVRVLVNADLPWRWKQYRRRYPDLFTDSQPDGGAALVQHQSGRRPLWTEGMQAQLLDVLCPLGMAAQAVWPRRGSACEEEMEKKAWMWELYVRRPPPRRVLLQDYYSRMVMKTVSSGAYNAGLLLDQSGRKSAARQLQRWAVYWRPDKEKGIADDGRS
jgi:hypothetical protein